MVIKQHERACTEKHVLEEKLKATAEEYDNLKLEFEEMLRQWLTQYPGDWRGSTNFPAYSKLHTSLVKIEVGCAASDLVTYNSLTSYHPKS